MLGGFALLVRESLWQPLPVSIGGLVLEEAYCDHVTLAFFGDHIYYLAPIFYFSTFLSNITHFTTVLIAELFIGRISNMRNMIFFFYASCVLIVWNFLEFGGDLVIN